MERIYIADQAIRLERPRRTPEGFLECDGVAAKVGAMDYPEHSRRVWVPASVLADVSSLRDAVITPEHPAGKVDARNVREHMRGWVKDAGYDAMTGEQRVRVRIVDASTIADVESGKLRELSPGYDVGLVPVSDAFPEAKAAGCTHVQVFRRVNHLALTAHARGGSTVRLFLDSAMTQPLTNDSMLPMAPMHMQAPMPQMPMQPQPQMPPMVPPQMPMDAAEWQKQYDALMQRKPAAPPQAPQAAAPQAPAAPPAPQANPEPPKPPMATDSGYMLAVFNGATKLGIATDSVADMVALEKQVVVAMVGDTMYAALDESARRGVVYAASRVQAQAQPAVQTVTVQAPQTAGVPASQVAQATQAAMRFGSMVPAQTTTAKDSEDSLSKALRNANKSPAELYGTK